jgi:hypothetical protein
LCTVEAESSGRKRRLGVATRVEWKAAARTGRRLDQRVGLALPAPRVRERGSLLIVKNNSLLRERIPCSVQKIPCSWRENSLLIAPTRRGKRGFLPHKTGLAALAPGLFSLSDAAERRALIIVFSEAYNISLKVQPVFSFPEL